MYTLYMFIDTYTCTYIFFLKDKEKGDPGMASILGTLIECKTWKSKAHTPFHFTGTSLPQTMDECLTVIFEAITLFPSTSYFCGFYSVSLGWDLIIGFFNKFPGYLHLADRETV